MHSCPVSNHRRKLFGVRVDRVFNQPRISINSAINPFMYTLMTMIQNMASSSAAFGTARKQQTVRKYSKRKREESIT